VASEAARGFSVSSKVSENLDGQRQIGRHDCQTERRTGTAAASGPDRMPRLIRAWTVPI